MIGGTALGFAAPAFAQDTTQPTEVQEIVVTGSRIKQPNLEAPTAVQVVTSRQIEATGQINTGDIIRTLPAAGVSTITPTNSGFQTAGNGITTVNLRNLGESRTLVLVNGRRFVPGVVGTQAVDFNTIPTDLIDRIDVVTGGASAIYGSDALAGVVNIITKQNFEGFQVNGQYGKSERSDDERYKISIVAGSNFADGRGNAVINLGFDHVGEILARNRRDQGMGIDATTLIAQTGDPEDYRGQIVGTFSSFIPRGRIIVPTPEGNLNRVLTDAGSIAPYSSSVYGFNRTAFRYLQVPSDRISVGAQVNYDFNEDHHFFSEVNYVQTKLKSVIEPTPLGSDQLYSGQLPFCDDFNGNGTLQCQFGIPLTSASVPDNVRQEVRNQVAAAVNDMCTDDDPDTPCYTMPTDDNLVVGFARRMNEIGARGNEIERHTFRAVLGLKGDFTENLGYEVSLNYGRTEDDQTSGGDVNTTRLRNALDTVIVGGQEVCRDPVAQSEGCVPVHIFGLNSISPAGVAYITAPTSRDASIEELVVNGFVHGNALDLPAGPLAWVLGGEYRQEKASDVPDALTQSGEFSGNATPPTVGQFDVYELFTELRVPILKDMPFAKQLDLNLAYRFSDYSTVNTTNAYSASLEYTPTDWVKFRGQYSRAVRAPDVSELFQPASQDFPTVLDPCAGVTRSGGQPAFFNLRNDINDPNNVLSSGVDASTIGDQTAANCLADPAIAARVNREGGLALTQFEAQGVSGFDGGNADLAAETATSWTGGILFNPRWTPWLEPFSLTIDYYDIKIKDVIAVIDEQDLLNNCYGAPSFDPSSNFCSAIVRFPTGASVGALQFVNQVNDNFASLRTKGIDVQASYNLDLDTVPYIGDNWGSILFSLSYNHLLEFKTIPFTGAAALNDKQLVGTPENKWLLDMVFSHGPLQLSWETQYIGESFIFREGDFTDGKSGHIGPRVFSSSQARYEVNDMATVYAGVDNIFDEYVMVGGSSGDVGQTTGWTTFPDIYDGLGRRYYAGVKLRF